MLPWNFWGSSKATEVLERPRNDPETTPKRPRNDPTKRPQIDQNGRFGVDLGSFWGRFGVVLGSIWGRFGVDLGSIWGRFGVDLGSICGRALSVEFFGGGVKGGGGSLGGRVGPSRHSCSQSNLLRFDFPKSVAN